MIGDNGDNGNSTIVLARHHGTKTGTQTLSTQSNDQIFRIRQSQIFASSGAITMQTTSWVTRSIPALAAIAVVAFTTGSASADGYQRGGVVPVARCANFGGFYVGGNIGWATLTAHQNDLDGVFTKVPTPTGFTATDDAFTAGAPGGRQLPKGCPVFGTRAYCDWGDPHVGTPPFPVDG